MTSVVNKLLTVFYYLAEIIQEACVLINHQQAKRLAELNLYSNFQLISQYNFWHKF